MNPAERRVALIPGGAKKDFSAAQARRLLNAVHPSDLVSVTRKRVAMELVEDLERIYQRKKDANKELVALVKTTGTGLLDLHGIGPSGAARLLRRHPAVHRPGRKRQPATYTSLRQVSRKPASGFRSFL